MDRSNLGRTIIYLGLFLLILGGLIYYFGGLFAWFGRLPGDIRIERENFRLYFPITSMIIITIVLNFLIRIVRYFIY
ncbi:DUF2905 domain-containing protein [Natronospora cellulosivora (SeqCode)]